MSTTSPKPRRKKGSGSIMNISRGVWRGYVTIDGKRRYESGSSRSDVEAKLVARAQRIVEEKEAAALAALPKPEDHSLLAAINVHLDAAVALSAKTKEGYLRARDNHLAELATVDVRDLTTMQVAQRYRAMSQSGLGRSTINQLRAILKKSLTTAAANGWCDRNVAAFVEIPEAAPSPRSSIDADELRALQDALTDHPLRARYEIGLRLGARPGEILGVRIRDIDFARSQFRVVGQQQSIGVHLSDGKPLGDVWSGTTKTSSGQRPIGIPADILDMIRMYLDDTAELRAQRDAAGEFSAAQERQARRIAEAQAAHLIPPVGADNEVHPLPSDLIWLTPNARLIGGTPLTTSGDIRIWKALLASAGLSARKRYASRHGVATRLFQEAATKGEGEMETTALKVSALLGHTSTDFTRRTYVKDMDAVVASFGQSL